MSDFERLPEIQREYEEFKQTLPKGYCGFCDPENLKPYLVEETKYFWVVKNRFPYANTKRHLLIIPKKHVANLSQLTHFALLEHAWLQVKYIKEFFLWKLDVMTRGEGNPGLSVRGHVHTHLIYR